MSSDAAAEPTWRPPALSLGGRAPAVSTRLGSAFWRLFGAGVVSSLGDGLVLVGFPLLALTLTTSPILITAVVIAGRLPGLVCAVPIGALADRIDRRRMVWVVNVVRVAVLACFSLLVLAGHDSLPALYLTVFALGAGDVAFNVATQSCLPGMVPLQDLPRANGYLATAEVSGEQFVGPGLGGLAFALARAVPFLGDALSFVASALLLRGVLPDAAPRKARRPFLGDVREGLRWFFGQRLLRVMGLVVASLAFCQAMVFASLVIYGTRKLGLDHAAYGFFFAGASAGNVVGSVFAGRIYGRLGPARCLAAAAVVAGGAYVVLSLTGQPVLAAAVLFLEAVGVPVGNVTTLSLRQRITPERLLGRVNSTFRLLIWGLIPLGALAGGILTATIGVDGAFRIAGVAQLGVFALAGPALVRRIRHEEAAGLTPAAGVAPDDPLVA